MVVHHSKSFPKNILLSSSFHHGHNLQASQTHFHSERITTASSSSESSHRRPRVSCEVFHPSPGTWPDVDMPRAKHAIFPSAYLPDWRDCAKVLADTLLLLRSPGDVALLLYILWLKRRLRAVSVRKFVYCWIQGIYCDTPSSKNRAEFGLWWVHPRYGEGKSNRGRRG